MVNERERIQVSLLTPTNPCSSLPFCLICDTLSIISITFSKSCLLKWNAQLHCVVPQIQEPSNTRAHSPPPPSWIQPPILWVAPLDPVPEFLHQYSHWLRVCLGWRFHERQVNPEIWSLRLARELHVDIGYKKSLLNKYVCVL